MQLDIKDNRDFLFTLFPELVTDPHFAVTSPMDVNYNCIAWANSRPNVWWDNSGEEGTTWPIDDLSDHYSSLVKLFESKGFKLCENSEFDKSFVKVAIYVDEDDNWTHAARQDRSGLWKSKLGRLFDIIHGTPHAIENKSYGKAKYFMSIKF